MTDANYKDGNILRKGGKFVLYIVHTTTGNWYHIYSDKTVFTHGFFYIKTHEWKSIDMKRILRNFKI